MKKLIIAGAICASASLFAQASTSNAELTEGNEWTGTAGASAVVNTGNAQNQTASGNFILGYKFGKNKVELLGNAAYGRAKPATGGAYATNTDNWKTVLRYDRYITDAFGAFAYGHAGQNRPAGFDWRYGGGAGVAHEIIKTDPNYLRYELGYDITREERVGVADDTIHSVRFFTIYTRKIGDWASFSQTFEALYNVEDSKDVRFNTLTNLTTKLSDKVGFQVGYGMRYDNQPVAGTRKLDTETQAGLTVNFL